MPDLVVKDSDNCWKFDGNTFCNISIEDKGTKRTIPVGLILPEKLNKIEKVNGCRVDPNTGIVMCSVDARGKKMEKGVIASGLFNFQFPTKHQIEQNRSQKKCDPLLDPYCRIM